ncbi:molybdopterin-dependent oxidoreductase [Pseudomonas aeruginosa]|nr:molybdopterin-dependent oxidoreductase [Pseudomonas aeruginosa]
MRLPPNCPPSAATSTTAYRAAPIRVEASYSTPIEHHNPMEPHASTVIVQPDGSLLVHDKTQGTQNSQADLQRPRPARRQGKGLCRLRRRRLRLRPASAIQLALAVMAALQLRRSVRVVLTRQQMFTFGYRPRTLQRLQLGADAEGRLLALGHQATAQTSRFEDFTEHVVEWERHALSLREPFPGLPSGAAGPLYPAGHARPRRGAGADRAGMRDGRTGGAARHGPHRAAPVHFAERNGNEDKPYSSKALLACYEEGARRFGWQARDPATEHERRAPVARLGHGRRRLGGHAEQGQREGAAGGGRPAAGGQRDHG